MVVSSGCVRRAFTLEGRGIWHAASISLAQQIWGPLRARLDTRLALDMTSQVIQPLPASNLLTAAGPNEAHQDSSPERRIKAPGRCASSRGRRATGRGR